MKKLLKWTGIFLLIIIVIIGAAVSLFFHYLSPAKLTPLVNQYSTEYLDATVNFDSVQVTFVEEFPTLSIKLVGGEIISHALKNDTAFLAEQPASADTLMRFNEFMISLSITDLLQNKISIERVRISAPTINAYVSPSGKANWEIYSTKPDSLKAESAPLDLNIDRFSIRGTAVLNYDSRPDSMKLKASIGRMFVRGKLTPDLEKLEVERFVTSKLRLNARLNNGNTYAFLSLDSARINMIEPRREYELLVNGRTSARVGSQQYCRRMPLLLNGNLLLNPDNRNFLGFKDFAFSVAELPGFKLNGDVFLNNGDITSDLICEVTAMPLQSLLNLVPKGFSPEIGKIQTDLKFNLNTAVKGTYKFEEKAKLPVVDVNFNILRGFLTYKDLATKIDNIAIDASLHYNPVEPKKTAVRLRNINLESVAATLKGNLDASNLLIDPDVKMNLNGTANLRELMKFAPESLGVVARGNIAFNAEGSFLMSKLTEQELAKNDLIVQFNADRLRLRIPKDAISVLAERTFLEINTTKMRTTRRGNQIRQLGVDFKSDTLRVRMPNREIIALSKADFQMRTSPDALVSADSTQIVPMVGNFTAATLQYSDVDSTTFRLRNAKSSFRIRPSRENRRLPSIRFDIEARNFNAFMQGNRFVVRDASIALTASKNPPATRRRRIVTPQRLDSLQRVYPGIARDSLVAHSRAQRRANHTIDDFAEEDIDMKNAELGGMLRQWKIDGSVKSRSGRMVSPYFPLRTRLQNLDLTFTTNDVTLNNIDVKSGKSQFNFNGKIDGIRRAMSTGRGLRVTADIKADTLNINELLTAATNGANFASASEEYKQAVANTEDEDQLEEIIQAQNEGKEEEMAGLMVVPSNVSVDISLDVKNGKYSNITIEQLTGALVSRDRMLQLKDLVAKTDVGQINMTALYATRSKKDITFGIDLEFKEIQVEKFIEIIPDVNNYLPMLLSFRGIITSQIAATAQVDSTMSLIMPSLNAACRIKGRDMVLLDGETFTEIAKTMRFKNKKENVVDSISVELLVKDNQIQIFPFIMQMDRYRAAIGGTHNLDMTFDYHISVLKSPLPFKLGVNLRGNLDDMDNMKFKLGRARYKDNNLQASVVNIIDDTRFNLRTQINNFIQYGVDAARFSQFAAPVIEMEKDTVLSAQDSLMLQQMQIQEQD